ncbi:hypothetical protein TNCT_118801 [Trichonephila clavata]|uniref:Uncharacterized protein n=1 Tax=Trichonephila clavata TaxID=2740835 RepID=A0A8X6IH23_TRICU|nr:hypothetical protein TNCT_118801 [Trichonephila clavata]
MAWKGEKRDLSIMPKYASEIEGCETPSWEQLLGGKLHVLISQSSELDRVSLAMRLHGSVLSGNVHSAIIEIETPIRLQNRIDVEL